MKIWNLQTKYQPQNKEFGVYKRRIGVRYNTFWQKNGPISNPKSSQKQFYSKNLQNVPHALATTLMERLKDYDSTHPRKATGKEHLFNLDCGESKKLVHRKRQKPHSRIFRQIEQPYGNDVESSAKEFIEENF